MGIPFMTLPRRSPAILREVANTPRSAWRTVHLDVPHRMYQTPRVVDKQVTLRDDEGPIRQMLISDLGHEEPTVLLTNDLRTTAAKHHPLRATDVDRERAGRRRRVLSSGCVELCGPSEDRFRHHSDRSSQWSITDVWPPPQWL